MELFDPSISIAVARAHGGILLDGKEVASTLQCCHCGCHWTPQRGSGRIRGKCMRCNALTCGRVECDPCDPWEAKMERMERLARE